MPGLLNNTLQAFLAPATEFRAEEQLQMPASKLAKEAKTILTISEAQRAETEFG